MTEIDPFAVPSAPFMQALGLHVDEVTAAVAAQEGLTARLDVDERHHTPWGVVHGGVWSSVVETVASIGASLAVADRGQFAVGVNNLTDFVRPVQKASVSVEARPLQVGRSMQLWYVQITDDDGKLIAHGRVRLANQPIPGGTD